MKRFHMMLLSRVLLAVLLAFVVGSLKWKFFSWGGIPVHFLTTPLYPVLLLLIVFLLSSALGQVVLELYRRRSLPGIQKLTEKLVQHSKTATQLLSVQFVFWGILVVAGVGAAWKAGVLEDQEFKLNQIPPPGASRSWISDSPVRVLHVYSGDNNKIKYLEAAEQIVKDLKDAGVKVVLMPTPSPTSKREFDLLERIARNGIVIFGVENIRNPILDRKDLPVGIMDINPDPERLLTFVYNVVPFPSRYRTDMPDAALEVAGKYFGTPVRPSGGGPRLNLGGTNFPLSTDGSIYLGGTEGVFMELPVNAGYDMAEAKELTYSYPSSAGQFVNTASQQVFSKSLDQYRESLNGTVVVMEWKDLSRFNPVSYQEAYRYAVLIHCLIHGDVLTVSDGISFLLVILSVLCCGFILYRNRPLVALVLLIIVSAGVLLGSLWLFLGKAILVDIPALLAALVVSTMVFSIVRMGYEWRRGATTQGVVGRIEGAGPQPAVASITGRVGTALRRPLVVGVIVAAAVIMSFFVGRVSKSGGTDENTQTSILVTTLPVIEVRAY